MEHPVLNPENEIIGSINGKLNNDATVFQAECAAVLYGTQLLEENEMNEVVLLTDSQALVKAMASHQTTSKLISEARDILNTASTGARIEIRWIKAHVGHYGNELADQLAKDGALGMGTGPYRNTSVSSKVISRMVNDKIIEQCLVHMKSRLASLERHQSLKGYAQIGLQFAHRPQGLGSNGFTLVVKKLLP